MKVFRKNETTKQKFETTPKEHFEIEMMDAKHKEINEHA